MSEGAFEFIDGVLSVGAMFDPVMGIRATAGAMLGLMVGYATHIDSGLNHEDLRALLARHGIESACWQIAGELILWQVPRDKMRWAEAVMDNAGVYWWGGVETVGEWLGIAVGARKMRYGAAFRGGHAAGEVHGG